MVGLLLLFVAGIGLVSKNDHSTPDAAKWQTTVQQSITELKSELKTEHNPRAIKQLENQLKIKEYALAHDTPPINYSVWSYTEIGTQFISLVSLLVIVVAGGIVANEFSWGTVKSLLVKPYSRSKILLAKYLCVLQFALFLLIVLFASTFLCKGMLFGFTHMDAPYLFVDAVGNVQEGNMILSLLSKYGLASVELLFVATIAFMLSSIFRNPSLAIGMAFILQLVGSGVTQLLAAKYSWAKYSLFANTSLSMYTEGSPLIDGMTLSFSLTVLLVYYLLFLAVTWTGFTKRDIAG